MDAPNVTPIAAGRTEAQIAEDYRKRMLEVLGAVLDIINEARHEHGMSIAFQIGPPDGFNRQGLAVLEISKKLC